MISFANAKINLGLNITAKRPDGYHELQTVFYPFGLYDIIEINTIETRTTLTITGIDLQVDESNLCLKAYRLLATSYALPEVAIHLHKQIPFGAGLGGGSSDAAVVLKMLNDKFQLNLAGNQLVDFAAMLGADCPFFIRNSATYATGTGTTLHHIDLDLSDKFIVLIKPDIHISTQQAYAGISPVVPEQELDELITLPIQDWKFYIKNDFEDRLFELYPIIRDIKLALYENGALYASMSGSGSSVYGIFDQKVDLSKLGALGTIYYPVSL
ncbi:4-(cytidine 5'-diphospho)-2-C-methyl-D-erythritol kinase [Sphingobacterium shayense]|uniref:4-(cytidine 5'-diphospho)-2-C-methyl-D-erythritol kinase n=1 Tax=Sphingobacterium shayense TaxID=626343 RepID=UPI0015536FC2|nr:4-(cytidine 5'-diphospho)-2-C-methyl-D-erythritol kinase [Sphingobacterium shayense]NQD69298.1 4-(cytidine 5'-diphospho)-2-C-methyl-D-erythritol kinase [Sphingobacterium shayense]